MKDKKEIYDLMRFNDLEFFMKSINKGYIINFHVEEICKKLMRIVKGEQLNLIISMQPRAGKSMLIAEHFPAFFLGHHPEKDIILTGYSSDIAKKYSTTVRDVYEKYVSELNGVKFSKDTNAKDEFKTTKGGILKASGIQATLTGYGGDLIIVDDPIKSIKESKSAATRQAVWEGFQANVWSRRSPTASVIIIQTRWHEDDLVGRILQDKEISSKFEQLIYPALSDEYENGVMFPQRFTKQDLLFTKKLLGSSIFEALYQQNPTIDGGNYIKKEWITTTTNGAYNQHSVVTSWDLAQSSKGDADFTVGQVWTKRDNKYILLEQVRGKWDFPEVLRQFTKISEKYPMAKHLVEGKASGKPLIQMLRRSINKIVEINPTVSKESRVEAISPLFESKEVVFLKKKYVEELISELIGFGSVKNDDQVDAMCQYLLYATDKKLNSSFSRYIYV